MPHTRLSPADPEALIAALLLPETYPHPVGEVLHLQTHISHVFLAGEFAYKIKKPVNFGFLDFTSLDRRRYYCQEEIRLNGRLAPQLYLDCVGLFGSADAPKFGPDMGNAFEYAVRMRRFPQEWLLDQQLEASLLLPQHIDALAQQLADFHQKAPQRDLDSPLGTPARVFQPMHDNIAHLRLVLVDVADRRVLERIADWTRYNAIRLQGPLAARKAQGWIRECHGDLHLGNMLMDDNGQVSIFDCIEFNDDFRWIDVMNDVAFLTMDLRFRGAESLAQRFLNTYLEYGGDFYGLSLLKTYEVYRAMVRAKINALQAAQESIPASARAAAWEQCRAYLQLAHSFTYPPKPFLLITQGLSGSGKSFWTQQLLERFPNVIRIRSDVERKRLFGLGPLEDSRKMSGQGLYTRKANIRTYMCLLERADALLEAGYTVLVDATFMKRDHRHPFRELAAQHSVPFVMLYCQADVEVLRERVTVRQRKRDDATEATVEVLNRQLRMVEPPTEDENALAINEGGDINRLCDAIRLVLGMK